VFEFVLPGRPSLASTLRARILRPLSCWPRSRQRAPVAARTGVARLGRVCIVDGRPHESASVAIVSLGYALPPELLVGVVGASGIGVGSVSRLLERRQERRSHKLAGEERQKIDEAIQTAPADITVYDAVDRIAEEAELNPSKVRDRVFGKVMADIAPQVDAWIYSVLPDRPRGAKRLLTQVHLMITVARGRGFFKLHDTTEIDSR
jgi:hypothetical protein